MSSNNIRVRFFNENLNNDNLQDNSQIINFTDLIFSFITSELDESELHFNQDVNGQEEFNLIITREMDNYDHSQLRRGISYSELNIDNYDSSKCKYEDCIICTENYTENENIVKLKCEHIFHINCIKRWGDYSRTCPICKTEV